MTEIIGVRFKTGGKQYYFDPKGIPVAVGDGVILSTSRGLEFGECIRENSMVAQSEVVEPLRHVVRLATDQDRRNRENNRRREKEAYRVCLDKIVEHKLDMKLAEVEYSFDGSKLLFFFTSENRVDFRNLVKDLAAQFHTRIELRQIGVRDEAKLVGGLGICGRPFCCNQFLSEFQPVSIKMAKTQNLSLNPTKISGTCGRLMCCLKYEQHAYEDATRRCPKQESFVETPDGAGTVYHVNLLREQIKVRLEDSSEQPKYYHNCEVTVVRNGKGKRPDGYVAPPKAQLEARRFVPEQTEDKAPAPERTALSSALQTIFTASQTGDKPKVRPHTAKPGQGGGGNRPRPPKATQQPKFPPNPEAMEEKIPRPRNRRWRGKPKGKA